MYIDKKYITIYTDIDYESPDLFINFLRLTPNLRLDYKSNSALYISFGFFSKCLYIEFKWGHVERERNKREEETYQRTLRFFENKKDKETLSDN